LQPARTAPTTRNWRMSRIMEVLHDNRERVDEAGLNAGLFGKSGSQPELEAAHEDVLGRAVGPGGAGGRSRRRRRAARERGALVVDLQLDVRVGVPVEAGRVAGRGARALRRVGVGAVEDGAVEADSAITESDLPRAGAAPSGAQIERAARLHPAIGRLI